MKMFANSRIGFEEDVFSRIRDGEIECFLLGFI